MHTRNFLLIFLLFFILFNGFSQEVKTNSVNVQFTAIPTLTTIDFTRGLTFDWINSSNQFNIGISAMVLNKDYTSIKGLVGYDLNLSNRLDIPLYLAGGFRVKNVSISSDNQEGFSLLGSIISGLEFRYSEDWSYTLLGIFDYVLNMGTLVPHISLGVRYRF